MAGSIPNEIDEAALIQLWRTMKLSRGLEEHARTLYRTRAVRGAIPTARGGEAIAAGATAALAPTDIIAPGRANLGAYLMRGITPAAIVQHWYTYSLDETRRMLPGDLHGSMVLPSNHTASDALALAVGVALSIRLHGEMRIVLAFCTGRDLATGAFHEVMGYAIQQKLPFLCIASSDSFSRHAPASADYAAAYGLPRAVIDGNDVLEVFETVREQRQRILEQQTPGFIEARTVALTSEHGEDWQRRDPLARFTRYLLYSDILPPAAQATEEAAIIAEIEQAVAQATDQPQPVLPTDTVADTPMPPASPTPVAVLAMRTSSQESTE